MTLKLPRECKLIILVLLNLLLTTVIATSTSENSLIEPFAEYDTSPTKTFESGLDFDNNIFDDHNIATATELYESFLVRRQKGKPKGSLIRIIGPVTEQKRVKSECLVPFRKAKSMRLRRLSYKTVLFPIRAADEINGHEQVKFVLVNTDNCRYTYAVNATLPPNMFFYKNGNASDESFTIVMHDTKLCHGHTWCRLFFNPFYYKFQPLNFDFPSNQIRQFPEAITFDGNLFVVYLQDYNNTYKIRLYNVTNYFGPADYKELLSVENYGVGWYDRYEVVSSSLTHCWRTRQNTDEDKIVHCAKFQEDGTMVLNESVVYPDNFRLGQVQSVPNGLILISQLQRNCSEKMCPTVRTTVITKKSKCINDNNNNNCSDLSSPITAVQGNNSLEIKHREYVNFVCRSFIFAFRFFQVNESDNSLRHICIGFGPNPLQKLFNKVGPDC